MCRAILFLLLWCFPVLFCQSSEEEGKLKKEKSDPYEHHRKEMVERQIVARGVTDSLVLQAMMCVERHQFVPKNVQALAYYDEPLPIGHKQTISQPYIVAYMTEILALKGDEKVLEIGTGSGYQAAVLAEITEEVYTMEIVKPLVEKATRILDLLGYKNVHCMYGDGYLGWPEHAPFDAIIVTAAPPYIPEPLIAQLKEGGRMVLPVGDLYQELVLLIKKDNKINRKRLIPVRFVPMTGEVQKKK